MQSGRYGIERRHLMLSVAELLSVNSNLEKHENDER
jgi:hypothetical protein